MFIYIFYSISQIFFVCPDNLTDNSVSASGFYVNDSTERTRERKIKKNCKTFLAQRLASTINCTYLSFGKPERALMRSFHDALLFIGIHFMHNIFVWLVKIMKIFTLAIQIIMESCDRQFSPLNYIFPIKLSWSITNLINLHKTRIFHFSLVHFVFLWLNGIFNFFSKSNYISLSVSPTNFAQILRKNFVVVFRRVLLLLFRSCHFMFFRLNNRSEFLLA